MDISVSDAPVGRLLDGRYRVEALLARGGMATVYRAVDTRLDRRVALKVMHAELAADDEFVARFIGEARSAARLSDPHVVGVFDQGEDSGAVYLAMEFVDGRTLREVLRERQRLDAALALEVAESVLSALSAAHQAGIIHRDVKPENVLVGNDGRVRVADFGLARAVSTSTGTTRGLLLGTVNYISPEQALGESATTRSDVYSAGIMLFELLTGATPHTGPTDFVIVRRHIDEDVPAPSTVVPGIPPTVDELVRTATSREPGSRYADAGRFLAAIRQARATIGDGADTVADETVADAEPIETAGVTMSEALVVPVADIPDTDADAPAGRSGNASAPPNPLGPPPPPPPAAAAAQASQPQPSQTKVISLAPTAESPRRHSDRRDRNEAKNRAAAEAERRRSKRGAILFVFILLVAVGIAVAAWWFGSGRWTSTPSLLNLSAEAAEQEAVDAGLVARHDGEAFSETVEAGLVVSTDPRPGEQILRDGEIAYVVSKGPERYEVPKLDGLSLDDANAALDKATLTSSVAEEFHDTIAAGVVISQGTAPGEEARSGDVVALVVSKGREPVEITDFTGQSATDAEAALRSAGFTVTREVQFSGSVAVGIVLSQEPASGTGFRGDEVHLVISAGPEAIEVPQVSGEKLSDAQRIIEDAGLRVDVRGVLPNPDAGRDPRVLRQDPDGGTLPPDSAVTLWVF